jgi:voltage-gated potassium channel
MEIERLHDNLRRFFDPAVILAAVATVPLTIVEERGPPSPLFGLADWLIWSVFAAEFGVMCATAPDRRRYARAHWLNLLVVVITFPALPALLGLVRLFRLARFARVFRSVRTVAFLIAAIPALRSTVGRRGLLYVAGLTALLVLTGGELMTTVEPQTVGGGDLGAGMWWAIVTVTTVGYGDISPQTPLGRTVAAVLMFAGMGLVATLAASVAAYFVGEESDRELQEVTERLERIEDLLRTMADDRRPR